jgi:hypothetical protein
MLAKSMRGIPSRAIAVAEALALLLSACGSEDRGAGSERFFARGAASFSGGVPSVTVAVNGGADKRFALDTGVPVTTLETGSFPSLATGSTLVRLAMLGRSFGAVDAALGPGLGADGFIGGSFLRFFALGIDYQNRTVALSSSFEPSDFYTGADLLPATDLPIRIGGELQGAPSFRLLARAFFEGQAQPSWVIIDTGASTVVLRQALFDRLQAATPGRPILAGVPTFIASGETYTVLSRVWRIRLTGPSAGDPEVAVDDIPVDVIPDSASFLTTLTQELGVTVEANIGGSMLRNFFVTVDYPASRLRLARYRSESHIDPNEFVTAGFYLAPIADQWVISWVLRGSDAESKGLRGGDQVDDLGGTALRGLSAAAVDALMNGRRPGTTLEVGYTRAGVVGRVEVKVYDALPSFPPP